MNESRFVKLLNLYVDHELTAGEAAELEAELQRNPGRRRLLREYQQLQRGCERLLEVDRALAPRTAEAVRALRHRRSGESRWTAVSRRWSWFAGVGAATAAAAVAVIVVLRPEPPGSAVPATASVVAQSTVAAGTGTPAPLEMLDVTVPAVSERRGLRMRSLWTTASTEREATAGFTHVAASDLSWLNDVRLPAVGAPRPEDLLFRETARPLRPLEQIPPSQRPLQATLEMTAFQFQR
ncbi:MAG: hypothetical protein FJ382_04070 [Verrucomicrobia bacterium]|nr:hypothetical protein [Verrucomicrobiota bacterium]